MAFLHESSERGGAGAKAVDALDPKATAEKLLAAANDGAKSLKALFFWYVGALTYAIISVAGVTDEQLLRQSPLKLPILNVDIPLVEYFAFLPLVVVLAHIELLVQFALLSNKTNDLRSGLRAVGPEEAADFRLRLENFMLSHLLAGRHHAILHCLLFLLIYAALVALPLLTLLLIQAQFLSYHSEPMMWWHRALIFVDAAALLYFWPNLFHRQDMRAGAWLRLIFFRVIPRVTAFLLFLCLLYVLLAWLYWPISWITSAIAGVFVLAIILCLRAPQWSRGRYICHAAGRWVARLVLVPAYAIALLAIAYLVDCDLIDSWSPNTEIPLLAIGVLALSLVAFCVMWWRHRRSPFAGLCQWAARSHDFGLRQDAPGMTVFGAQCVMALVISIWMLVIPSSVERTVEVDEICRDLDRLSSHRYELSASATSPAPRWSSFIWLLSPTAAGHSKLENTFDSFLCPDDFRRALAGDIIESRASIPAILLSSFGKRRVLVLNEKTVASHELSPDLREKLRSGDAIARQGIEPIDLRGRNITGIQLKDAIVPRGKFERAQMSNSLLDGANLERASMNFVDLRGTSSQFAILAGLSAEGARLDRVMFSHSDLRGAYFEEESRLAASDFSFASMQGSQLTDVELSGAVFNGANLAGAYVSPNAAVGSSFSDANLNGAGFGIFESDYSLAGARMDNANLSGAVINHADVRGADFSRAVLDGAIIIDPIVGSLPSDDFQHFVRIAQENHLHEFRVDAVRKLVHSERGTVWPSEQSDCMLILSRPRRASMPHQDYTYPQCRFEYTVAGGDLALAAQMAPLSLWQNFGAIAALPQCDVSAEITFANKELALPALSFVIDRLANRRERETVIAAAISTLTTPDCIKGWHAADVEAMKAHYLAITESQWLKDLLDKWRTKLGQLERASPATP